MKLNGIAGFVAQTIGVGFDGFAVFRSHGFGEQWAEHSFKCVGMLGKTKVCWV